MGKAKLEIEWDTTYMSVDDMTELFGTHLLKKLLIPLKLKITDPDSIDTEALTRKAIQTTIGKIHAIKELRNLMSIHQHRNMGLSEAKDLIDREWGKI